MIYDRLSRSREFTAGKGYGKKDQHITVKKAWRSRFSTGIKKKYVKALIYDHGAGVF
jgi:hypothetical protein